jgi:hypothetical protein
MKKYLKGGLLVGGLAMVLTTGIFIGHATANQPHMRAALASLQNAQYQLSIAEHDKAGHRARALDLTNQAIAETQLGIEAGE